MTIIRTTRFTSEPGDTATVLERRRDLLAAVRERFAGPAETRLVRLDERTWLDIWRWDTEEALRAATEGAPQLPEAAAAFAVAREPSAEQGELVEEDSWTR